MKFYQAVLVCFFLSGIVFSYSSEQDNQFQFVFWPGHGSLCETTNTGVSMPEQLQTAWHSSHLPTYLKKNLRIVIPENSSLKQYNTIVQTMQPACIEIEMAYLEEVVNRSAYEQKTLTYLPILLVKKTTIDPDPIQAEILFRNRSMLRKGILGVVHPLYSIGGKTQLEYWQTQIGTTADMVAFYSPNEVLRHLFAGTIQAAAIPRQDIELFLQKAGKEKLPSSYQRIPVPDSISVLVIGLRADLFHDNFIRTLVSETWLRDHFPAEFKIIPSTGPKHRIEGEVG